MEREKEKHKGKKSSAKAAAGKVAGTSAAWPMNRQAEKQTKNSKKKEQGPMFPFEMETM